MHSQLARHQRGFALYGLTVRLKRGATAFVALVSVSANLQLSQRVMVMKLEITGTFGLLMAVGVCAFAAAAWSEPSLSVISAENGRGYCPVPVAGARLSDQQASPDLLLLMFSLSQGRAAQG